MTSGRPDYTGDIYLVGQSVNVDVNVAASAVTLNVNLTSSSITLNVNLTSSSITLNVNLSSQSANVDINLKAQTIDVDVNIEGPTGGYALEVTSDFSVQSQSYSRRGQISSWNAQSLTAATRKTLTNSTNFINPQFTIESSAACTITLEILVAGSYITVISQAFLAGEAFIILPRDKNNLALSSWGFGDAFITATANTTVDVSLLHLP